MPCNCPFSFNQAGQVFDEYCEALFWPHLSILINIIWDIHRPNGKKKITSENIGKILHRNNVSGLIKVSIKFLGFPTSFQKNDEPSNFLTNIRMRKKFTSLQVKENVCYVSIDYVYDIQHCKSNCNFSSLCQPCDHEENNIKICVHLKDVMEMGIEKIWKNS